MGNSQAKPPEWAEDEEEDGDYFEDAAQESVPAEAEAGSSGGQTGSSGGQTNLYKFILADGEKEGKYRLAQKKVDPVFLQEEPESDEEEGRGNTKSDLEPWYFFVKLRKGHLRSLVTQRLGMRFNDDELRVDFKVFSKDKVQDGCWAVKFGDGLMYNKFATEFQRASFENTFGLEDTKENREKAMGPEFVAFLGGSGGDETMWDADDDFTEGSPPELDVPALDKYEDAAPVQGAQSLAMGAMANSFLIHSSGIDVFSNASDGIKSRGVSVRLGEGSSSMITPKKGLLMRGEATMMLLSPLHGAQQVNSVRQLDLEQEKIVSEWAFQKDNTAISMRDIQNDTKSSQLDKSGATFMGLDDNRLCRWDMRDKHGIVQDIASPALTWAEGHQFSRGTNFRCMATAGNGSVAVGSLDGKIRLYGTTSLRQAKTSFPSLGASITSIDVTFDGKWIVATTDTFLVVLCTVFKDKDGSEKSGFQGKGAGKLAPPRLLKLRTDHAYLAGDKPLQGGQFSWVTEEGRQERNLVAHVGHYSVIWNLRRVKTNHDCYTQHGEGLKSCYCYKVVPKNDTIIDSRFMHDDYHSISTPDAPLVVASSVGVGSFLQY